MRKNFFKRSNHRMAKLTAPLRNAVVFAFEAMESRVLMSGTLTNFTQGDLVVVQGGDATHDDSASGAYANGLVPMYLDEYTPAGAYVGDIAVTNLTLAGQNFSNHEGNLNLSTNGGWLTFGGYQGAVSTTPHATDGTETDVVDEIGNSASSLAQVAVIPGAASPNSNLSLTGQYIRFVTSVDGNEFYVGTKYINTADGNDVGTSTDSAGILYVNGTSSSSGQTIQTIMPGTDWRNAVIVNNTLYGGVGSSSVGTHGPYLIGSFNSLPTPTGDTIPGYTTSSNVVVTSSSTTLTHTDLAQEPSGSDSYVQSVSNLALLDVTTNDIQAHTQNGYNVMYTIGDQSVPGITKWFYNGSYWVDAGLQVQLSASNITNPTGLVATIDPNNTSWVDIDVSGSNGIYTYVDKSGDPTTAIPANAFSIIATPGSTESFYGLALAPSNSIQITTQPTNQIVNLGSSGTFTAAATGTPTPTVQWEVSTDGGNIFTPDTTDQGYNTDILTVGATATDNGYEYKAVFSNSQASIPTNAATLNVNVPLTITEQPSNQTTYQGGSAIFTAAAEGSSTPITVQWQESTDGGYSFNNIGSPTVINSTTASSSYILTDATPGQYAPQFWAVFSDAGGTSTTYPAALTITAGVAITQQSYSQAVFPGGTATFTAAAQGVVAPSVQWYVSTNSGSSYSPVGGASTSTSGNTTSTSLSVPASAAGNLYEATFTNSSGTATTHPGILDLDLTKFTEGDLVVMRLGDAAYPDAPEDEGGDTSNQVPIYLDEYTPAGTYVGSVAVPSSGFNSLTLPGGGDDEHQGDLSLSTNGAILTFGGYQVPEGSADANQQGGDDQPVIGYIDNAASTLNTATIVDSYGAGSDNPFFRGAYTNYGTSFWTFGKYAGAVRQSQTINGNGGLEYVTGTGPTAVTTDVETYADYRYVTVINGQLYGAAGSSSVGIHGPYIIGNSSANLSSGIVTQPTTNLGQNTSNNELLGSYPGGQSASNVQMVDLPDNSNTQNGMNVMYTIGDQNGPPAITKYYWNGTAWTLIALAQNISPVVDGNAEFNPTGLIAVQDPSNPDWVDLTLSGQDGVFTYVDKTGSSGALPGDAFTELAAAPTDGEFRGISVAPLFWEAPNSVASWNAYTKTLTVTGPAAIIADPGSDEPIIQANGSSATLTIDQTSDLQIHLGGFSLTHGATATVVSLGNARTKTNHLVFVIGAAGATTSPLFNIDSTSDLDLTDNDMVIHDGNLAAVTSMVKSGYDVGYGYWNGYGIESSVAAANSLDALGVAQPTSAGTFDNQSVGTSDVEIRYTYYGDADLNGHVDGSDYSKIDNGYLRHLTGWGNGDFNYDGFVNGSDYTLIDNAFNMQGASLAAQIAPAVQLTKISSLTAQPANVFSQLEITAHSQSSWSTEPVAIAGDIFATTDGDDLRSKAKQRMIFQFSGI